MSEAAMSPEDLLGAAKKNRRSLPLYVTGPEMAELPDAAKAWVRASRRSLDGAFVSLLPDEASGERVAGAVLNLGPDLDPFAAGSLTKHLPAGHWHIETKPDGLDMDQVLLGYLLGGYAFGAYKSRTPSGVKLRPPEETNLDSVLRKARAVYGVRDLVNTPANDMGPAAIEAAARTVARAHKATVKVISGDDLLRKNFPLVHAVGRAAADAPRLIDIRWGKRSAPKLTLVGKGVAYDTGGLNIKPGGSMRNMKKDMGGAAHTIALANMIMEAQLNVRLRLLIPAVENSISAPAFRPGDVYPSREGLTVEIGNTDAEGRLILADALTYGDEDMPELMVDFATLTGAARVALGPDVAPFFTDDEALARELAEASTLELDPVWRMPLWKGYAKNLSSNVADCGNISTDPLGGAITAALFLQKFVKNAQSWVHFDVFAWSPSSKPHASIGGEAQGLRALYSVLERRYPPAA
ncbi:MAG: leucyl aminopeptidase family protein [Pseudomonadota bacterium]